MNIKTRPLMIGAGAGAVLLIITSLIVQAGNYFVTTSLTGSLDDPNAIAGGLGFGALSSCLGFICPTLSVIVAGYLYGHFASQEMPLETQDLAVGGAATGAIAGIVYGVVNAILGIVLVQFILADAYAEITELAGPSPFGNLTGTTGALLGGLGSSCCWLVAGAVLGAVGGIIAGAIANRGKA